MSEFWFDTRTGDLLIGEAAAAPRLEEAGPDILPLPELLVAEPFPVGHSEFEKTSTPAWSRQDILQLGAWTLKLLEQSSAAPVELKHKHINRLYLLGLAPHFVRQEHFQTMGDFRVALGQPRGFERGLYDDWSLRDWTAYAQRVSQACGGKPHKSDYAHADGPGIGTIEKRFGGINALNTLIGYPDIRNWTTDDYINWGVGIIRTVGVEGFTYDYMRELSRQKRGPSDQPIVPRFGSWSNFKQLIVERHQEIIDGAEAREAEKLAEYRARITSGEAPSEWANLEKDQLFAVMPRYRLVHHLLREYEGAAAIAKRIALYDKVDITDQIQHINPDISVAEIESAAQALHIYGDIWPPDDEEFFVQGAA